MKTIAIGLLIFFSLLGEISLAQNYFPFPDSNATWNTVGHNIFSGHNWNFRYAVAGDTIIDSVEYHKVYEMYDSTILHPNSTYFAAIRENANRQVFCLIPGFTETLLFDFNLEVGDTIWYAIGGVVCYNTLAFSMHPHFRTVTAIDSFQLKNGQYRKRWDLTGVSNDIWVEGIGSLNYAGLFHPLISDIALCGDSYHFACYKQDNAILYLDNPSCGRCFCQLLTRIEIRDNADKGRFELFPNPATCDVTIKVNGNTNSNYSLQIFNSYGALVCRAQFIHAELSLLRNHLRNGLYLVQVYDDENNCLGTKKLIIE